MKNDHRVRESLDAAYPPIELPDVDVALQRTRSRFPTVKARRVRWPVLAVAAAVPALIGTGLALLNAGDDCMYPKNTKRFAVAASLWMATACADQLSTAVTPAFAPPEGIVHGRVEPGTWTYVITRIADQEFGSHQGTKTVTIAEAVFQNQMAWRVVTNQEMVYANDLADTLWLEQDQLRPLSRRWRRGRSLSGGVVVEDGQVVRTIGDMAPEERVVDTEDEPDGVYAISRDNLFLILQSLELSAGWLGSIRHTMYDPSFDIMVMGDTLMTVPAGTFSVWTVQATANRYKQSIDADGNRTLVPRRSFYTWWISKDEGWMVKTDSYFDQGFRSEDDVMVMELAAAPTR